MRWIIPVLVIVVTGCTAVPRSFTPANPIGSGEFSHQLFGQVLAAYVKDGSVDYPAVQGDGRLPAYVALLDRVDPSMLPARNERLAFWINAYNAFAIQGILDGYSPMTYLGRYRYFIGKDYRVGGAAINLYDLERQVLITQFHEPLVHFAIVCASRSCPKLQSWSYEPDRLEQQLEQVARAFLNDPSRNRFDPMKKVASISMIFKWFEEDFQRAAGSVSSYLARYVSDPDLAQALRQSEYRIDYLDYDWTLNGIPPGEMTHVGSP